MYNSVPRASKHRETIKYCLRPDSTCDYNLPFSLTAFRRLAAHRAERDNYIYRIEVE